MSGLEFILYSVLKYIVIISQYYFGDFNLPRDKFLKEQIKLDEGWVPLEIMIKFNRLNRLTTDFNVIVEALSKSKAELMEISEDKTKIRRSPSKPLPEVTDEYKNDVKNRSVYIVKSHPVAHVGMQWFDHGPLQS
uniref:HTH La-type RNA-binding domain-containing protein n=1 Tax=Papio anubis TaxID=9555 RepID=A0A8I5NN54_PAPAN